MPDIDGGDNHFLQVNMMEINKLANSQDENINDGKEDV
jgi:hypothetical protein